MGSTRAYTDATNPNPDGVKLYDYLPFGEDLVQGDTGRGSQYPSSASLTIPGNVTQRFTSKERDAESGLDYFGARYYSGPQGRFTSPDPVDPVDLNEKELDQHANNPQNWNKYGYVRNNPMAYIDPTGKATRPAGTPPQIEEISRLRQEFQEARGFRKLIAGIQLVLASDVLPTPFGLAEHGLSKSITALDTNALIDLEKLGSKALKGISGRLVICKSAFSELVAGSGLEKANELLAKFGIEKFFGIKNMAAFEEALEQSLKAGLTPQDASILATAKAQGTRLLTTDKNVIKVAKKIGVEIVKKEIEE